MISCGPLIEAGAMMILLTPIPDPKMEYCQKGGVLVPPVGTNPGDEMDFVLDFPFVAAPPRIGMLVFFSRG